MNSSKTSLYLCVLILIVQTLATSCRPKRPDIRGNAPYRPLSEVVDDLRERDLEAATRASTPWGQPLIERHANKMHWGRPSAELFDVWQVMLPFMSDMFFNPRRSFLAITMREDTVSVEGLLFSRGLPKDRYTHYFITRGLLVVIDKDVPLDDYWVQEDSTTLYLPDCQSFDYDHIEWKFVKKDDKYVLVNNPRSNYLVLGVEELHVRYGDPPDWSQIEQIYYPDRLPVE